MPCEGCHVQFTVFKRKRSCFDCKRYYCHNCLANYNSNTNNNNRKHALCERCLLFSKRPLVRSDLIKLKPKDLIFYLQSKHISTAGCVEKEELIDLVLQYVNRADMSNQPLSTGSGSSSSSNSQHTTPKHQSNGASGGVDEGGAKRSTDYGPSANNSFDSIKQTCQNFFSSLSDNISDSLANLESRACSKNRETTNMTSSVSGNVTEQPRVATRVIPTYASSQQNSPEYPTTTPVEDRNTSANSIFRTEGLVVNLPPNSPDNTSFNDRTRSPKSELEIQQNLGKNMCGPSTSTSTSKAPSQYSKLEIYVNDDEDSSHSSFEELGAIGGISDDSKTTTDTTSNTTDHWQMLDLKNNETETTQQNQNLPSQQPQDMVDKSAIINTEEIRDKNRIESDQFIKQPPPTPTHAHPAQRVKKVTRRRSESYLNRRRPHNSVDDEDEDINHVLQNPRIEEENQNVSTNSVTTGNATSPTKRSCTRCGKNKAGIRQQVEKMRQHLESSQMSESDIKQELTEFLSYLEQRTKSIEYSDSEAGISTASVSRQTNEIDDDEEISAERSLEGQAATSIPKISTGITAAQLYDKDTRFINLDEIESIKQLECLSVKQLKEILMLHRVDYKGCCEKQELLDRVIRLWKNLKSTPAVEKLPTDELCKICMDAPIECVILECGHMATCTNCGKVLSECPICRQYIVRVVRFFRA
ncbi:uncharacterized protein ACRADG_011979 isoform 2-T2 [Cochliomyia hominivorax]